MSSVAMTCSLITSVWTDKLLTEVLTKLNVKSLFVIVDDEVVDVYQIAIAASADGFKNRVIDAFLMYINNNTQIEDVN